MTERISAAEFRAAQDAQAAKGPNKYGAERTEVNGITFDSKREATRYAELLLLERQGHIRDLELQVPIHLEGRDAPLKTESGRPMRYVADFRYFDVSTGLVVIEDAKGKKTKEYLIKKTICAAMGLEIREI